MRIWQKHDLPPLQLRVAATQREAKELPDVQAILREAESKKAKT